MKSSKNYYSKGKIIIYHQTLLERIFGGFSVIGFMFLSIFGLTLPVYTNTRELISCIIILLAAIIYSIISYFIIFKAYLCLDIERKIFVIRDMSGKLIEEFRLKDIVRIEISEEKSKTKTDVFSINLVFPAYTRRFYDWSLGYGSIPLFRSYKSQRKRLEMFAEQCNKVIGEVNYN